jgi:hypothetical protein
MMPVEPSYVASEYNLAQPDANERQKTDRLEQLLTDWAQSLIYASAQTAKSSQNHAAVHQNRCVAAYTLDLTLSYSEYTLLS